MGENLRLLAKGLVSYLIGKPITRAFRNGINNSERLNGFCATAAFLSPIFFAKFVIFAEHLQALVRMIFGGFSCVR